MPAASAADARAALADHLRDESLGYVRFGSPLYGALAAHAADDVAAGGPSWEILDGLLDARRTYVALHLFGAVHRLVLQGRAPAVAAHYPSAGGDGDTEAAWRAIHALIAERTSEVRALAARPIQTNEPGRSSALLGGFLTVAGATGLPLRLLEVGSSAGLNLRWDRFRYESAVGCWGPPDSPVVFRDVFVEAAPPLDVTAVVAERSGCDASPVDVATEDGRLSLMSYVWPDQLARFHALEGAIAIAGSVPASIVRADAEAWLSEVLADPVHGVATVLFHSVFLHYLHADARRRLLALIDAAAARATRDAPLAHLTLEPVDPDAIPPEFAVRLRMWPPRSGAEELLAVASAHGPPVRWLAPR